MAATTTGEAGAAVTPKHFNIVALETFFTPIPPLSVPSPHTFTLTEYEKTSRDEVPSRIKDADIVITTIVPMREKELSPEVSPNLKLISVMASGTDSVDLDVCASRGIRVLNSPNCNVEVVTEHAMSLYFACRRFLFPTMRHLKAGDWPRRGTLMKVPYTADRPPRSCRDEVVAMIGHGGVGKRIAKVFGDLGMKIIIAGRKGEKTAPEPRVPFDEALKAATVIVVCCPRLPETLNLISEPEFALMKEDAVLVNVARGGIVNEPALVKALSEGQIAGAGVDVFDQEPASPETSCLLAADTDSLNLVVTAHTAWVGGETQTNYQRALQENIMGFLLGNPKQERIRV